MSDINNFSTQNFNIFNFRYQSEIYLSMIEIRKENNSFNSYKNYKYIYFSNNDEIKKIILYRYQN